MASYSTIPAADVETEQPLLKRDVKLNVKTVLEISWTRLCRNQNFTAHSC